MPKAHFRSSCCIVWTHPMDSQLSRLSSLDMILEDGRYHFCSTTLYDIPCPLKPPSSPPGVYWCQIPGAKTGPFFIFQISVMLLWINNCNVCVCNAVYRRLWNVFTYTWKSLNRRSCHRRSCRRRNCRRRNCYREGNPAISKSKLLMLLLNASLLHVHLKKCKHFTYSAWFMS